jgi:hypothetical protein
VVVRTTPEHPFYAEDRGWVECRELKVGDRLLCEDGGWVAVEDTYFVGCDEWGSASGHIMQPVHSAS